MVGGHTSPMEALLEILEAEESLSGFAATIYLSFLPLLLLRLLQGVEDAIDVVVLPDELGRELRKPIEDC